MDGCRWGRGGVLASCGIPLLLIDLSWLGHYLLLLLGRRLSIDELQGSALLGKLQEYGLIVESCLSLEDVCITLKGICCPWLVREIDQRSPAVCVLKAVC